MSFIDIKTERSVGIISFNRPGMRNAFLREMYRDCVQALNAFAEDDSIHAVVLRGEGPDFCTGNDLNEFIAIGSLTAAEILDRDATPSTDMVHVVADFPKPLIAAVQGRAIGWGTTMLLHCDLVIADIGTRLFFKFAAMGLVPEGGATRLLKDRIGLSRASHILLSGGSLSDSEALSLGLLAELTEAGTATERALAVAHQIAANPPRAVQATKRLIREEGTRLSEHIDLEFESFAERLSDPESQAIFARMVAK